MRSPTQRAVAAPAALAFFLIALALLLPGCGGGTLPTTELSETVKSYCLVSRAQHEGHRDACAIRPTAAVCTPARLEQEAVVHAQAQTLCAGSSPAGSDALAKIKALVAQQQALAR